MSEKAPEVRLPITLVLGKLCQHIASVNVSAADTVEPDTTTIAFPSYRNLWVASFNVDRHGFCFITVHKVRLVYAMTLSEVKWGIQPREKQDQRFPPDKSSRLTGQAAMHQLIECVHCVS
jgi:hypothetical protein